MQAKTLKVAALLAAWLGMSACIRAQGFPGSFASAPGGGVPPPIGVAPSMMPGGGPMPGAMGGMPPMMAGGPVPSGAYPSGAMPPGMPPGPMPGMMPPSGMGPMPGMPPVGTGIPGNLTHEVDRNAWNGTAEDPDQREVNPVRWQFTITPFAIWINGPKLPPTVTTGDFLFDPVPGALGQPGTRVLFGGRPGGDASAGIKFGVLYWLTDDQRLAVDVSYFITETRTFNFDRLSDTDGNPVLTRPFFNPNAHRQDADPRALPNVMRGSVHDDVRVDYQGAEANLRYNLTDSGRIYGYDWFLLGGPRWLQLDERYRNFDRVQELPPNTGNKYIFSDNFNTANRVYAGQVGLLFRSVWERLTLDLSGKFIGGFNDQSLRISGFTQQTDPFGNVVFDGRQALYAQPSNVGIFSRNRFAYGMDTGVNFGFLITDMLRLNFGYNFFYLQNVARVGNQIDTTVNIQPLNSGGGFGVARPLPIFRESTFVNHIVNFGFELLY
jgi:hypothetical protein